MTEGGRERCKHAWKTADCSPTCTSSPYTHHYTQPPLTHITIYTVHVPPPTIYTYTHHTQPPLTHITRHTTRTSRMGSWALLAWPLILAGVEANCGEDAKVVRASTASMRGLVVSAHASLLRSESSPARDCRDRRETTSECTRMCTL